MKVWGELSPSRMEYKRHKHLFTVNKILTSWWVGCGVLSYWRGFLREKVESAFCEAEQTVSERTDEEVCIKASGNINEISSSILGESRTNMTTVVSEYSLKNLQSKGWKS